jgi:hypothetical protein
VVGRAVNRVGILALNDSGSGGDLRMLAVSGANEEGEWIADRGIMSWVADLVGDKPAWNSLTWNIP